MQKLVLSHSVWRQRTFAQNGTLNIPTKFILAPGTNRYNSQEISCHVSYISATTTDMHLKFCSSLK